MLKMSESVCVIVLSKIVLLFEFIVERIHVIKVKCLLIQIVLHIHKDLLVEPKENSSIMQELKRRMNQLYVLEK